MTKVALSILLLLSAFSLAAPNPDEYSINVHVISSHWIMEPSIGTGPEAFQKLDAMIDGSETESVDPRAVEKAVPWKSPKAGLSHVT